MTSSPSTLIGLLLRLRRAMCETARPSVVLIDSPVYIRSIQSDKPNDFAKAINFSIVSFVIRFFE